MDAQNRLQHLEVIRPTENINLLNVKFRNLQHPRHARPIVPQYRDDYVNTFYDQTGSYIQERSGLYHTENYEPSSLAQAIPELENQEGNPYTTTEDTHDLNDLLDQSEQDQNRAKPKLFQYKAIGDYQNMRVSYSLIDTKEKEKILLIELVKVICLTCIFNFQYIIQKNYSNKFNIIKNFIFFIQNRLLNRLCVSHDAGTTDSRTQEGNKQFVQRESIYGLSYNTPKFLQDNTLSYHARIDPSRLMSSRYNNNLDRVRSLNSYPKKPTHTLSVNNNNILVSPVLRPSQYEELYSTKYITEHTNGYSNRSTVRVYDSPFKPGGNTHINQLNNQQQQQQSNTFDPILSIPAQIPRSAKTAIRLPGPEIVARFIEPKIEPQTTHQRSYKDISYHELAPQLKDNNQRFNPKPDNRLKQVKLRDIQDRWTKTQAQEQYHIEHPEPVPYVGAGIMRAQKEILIADAVIKRGLLTIR